MDWLSPVASVVGGVVSGGFGLLGQQKQFQYNKQLVDLQAQKQSQLNQEAYQMNLDQWNRENEYNAPKAQMARLQEAGLNPNLIYGSTDGGTASHSPQLEPANVGRPDAPDYGAVASQMFQGLISGSQLANNFAQADYTRAMAKKANAEAERLSYFNKYADKLYGSNAASSEFKQATEATRVDLFKQQLGLNELKSTELSKRIENMAIDISRNVLGLKYDTAAFDTNVQMLSLNLSTALVKLENMKKQGKLTDAQIRSTIASAIQMESNPMGLTGDIGNIGRLFGVADKDTFVGGALHDAQKAGKEIYDTAKTVGKGVYDFYAEIFKVMLGL